MADQQDCPNCGEGLSKGATTCPHCGARYGRNRGALFIAMALFIVGSGLWREGWIMPIIFWAGSAMAARMWLEPVWMIRDDDLQ